MYKKLLAIFLITLLVFSLIPNQSSAAPLYDSEGNLILDEENLTESQGNTEQPTQQPEQQPANIQQPVQQPASVQDITDTTLVAALDIPKYEYDINNRSLKSLDILIPSDKAILKVSNADASKESKIAYKIDGKTIKFLPTQLKRLGAGTHTFNVTYSDTTTSQFKVVIYWITRKETEDRKDLANFIFSKSSIDENSGLVFVTLPEPASKVESFGPLQAGGVTSRLRSSTEVQIDQATMSKLPAGTYQFKVTYKDGTINFITYHLLDNPIETTNKLVNIDYVKNNTDAIIIKTTKKIISDDTGLFKLVEPGYMLIADPYYIDQMAQGIYSTTVTFEDGSRVRYALRVVEGPAKQNYLSMAELVHLYNHVDYPSVSAKTGDIDTTYSYPTSSIFNGATFNNGAIIPKKIEDKPLGVYNDSIKITGSNEGTYPIKVTIADYWWGGSTTHIPGSDLGDKELEDLLPGTLTKTEAQYMKTISDSPTVYASKTISSVAASHPTLQTASIISDKILTFKKDLLDTLPDGIHTVTIIFKNGTTATLKILVSSPVNAHNDPTVGNLTPQSLTYTKGTYQALTINSDKPIMAVSTSNSKLLSAIVNLDKTITISALPLEALAEGMYEATVTFTNNTSATFEILVTSEQLEPDIWTQNISYFNKLTTSANYKDLELSANTTSLNVQLLTMNGVAVPTSQYRVIGNTIIISKAYLATKPISSSYRIAIKVDNKPTIDLMLEIDESVKLDNTIVPIDC